MWGRGGGPALRQGGAECPLRRGARRVGLDPVLPAEALDAAGRVHELLLAGEEGKAARADLDVDYLFHGGARLDHVAPYANELRIVVAGMHVLLPSGVPLFISSS